MTISCPWRGKFTNPAWHQLQFEAFRHKTRQVGRRTPGESTKLRLRSALWRVNEPARSMNVGAGGKQETLPVDFENHLKPLHRDKCVSSRPKLGVIKL